MKYILTILLIVVFSNFAETQGIAINPSGTTPDPSAGLDLGFTDKGFLLPRLTTAQRNAITTPAVGLQIYNTTVNCLQVYMPINGWRDVACDCNIPPVSTFNVPATISSNMAATFTPTLTSGVTYQWTFQSGSPASSVQQSPSVTWTTNGNYTVTLTVTDNNGCFSSSTQQVTVINCPPVTVFNFTSCSNTGRLGPTQAQCTAAYANTSLSSGVVYNNGIQEWTIPHTGPYRILAEGAGATNAYAGFGASVQAEFNLTAGNVLRVLVGQMGSDFAPSNADGGSGGSFVTEGANLLVVAGGGGGGGTVQPVIATDKNAVLTQTPVQTGPSRFGSAGAGYNTNGINFVYGTYTALAQSFNNGGAGQAGGQASGWPGNTRGDGGFGGGGSACACSTGHGGGGGGYAGGGGGQAPSTTGTTYYSGFGGSSFTAPNASNVSSSVLTAKGNGKVTVTYLCQ